MSYPKVTLHPKKERSVLLYHPWIFSGAVKNVEGKPESGEIVEVYSSEGKYLATGHFNDGSIKVRTFSFEKRSIDDSFWLEKLTDAFSCRERLSLTNNQSTNTYRLVHGEGDNMPGLIIDIYDSTAVIQTHSPGMFHIREAVAKSIEKIYNGRIKTIFDKSSDTISRQSGLAVENSFFLGNSSDGIVKENDLLFSVNWVEGQKTGFFLDQRENRKLLERYSGGKKVLNTFSYSGGFSMYALKGGAELVHSVDSSAKAVKLAEINAGLNNFTNHEAFDSDVSEFLKSTTESYDLIILDPPAFAKHINAVENAMVGYRNLNTEGIKRVAKGGIVFTFSCSQVVDRVLFRKLVFQAAAQAKRNVRILYQLSQGPDHPVNIYHPEGEYLKGLVLQVD